MPAASSAFFRLPPTTAGADAMCTSGDAHVEPVLCRPVFAGTAARASRNPPRFWPSGPRFWQPVHLQPSEQYTFTWKHSQYFFRQPLRLHLHPRLCRAGVSNCSVSLPKNLGLNARGLRLSICARVSLTTASFSTTFMQFWQLQLRQYKPAAKHSQYSLRHLLFAQLHFFTVGTPGVRPAGPQATAAWPL
eukprot:CAMPEP_0205950672 /NCGR_PEP_ID=MMETSP1459-20131121/2479_1 /ASSEMBLY_ACC=CAM_ASM_001120 /TAXON_ID=41880 /ORGANISM="Pycnococcus provasolii, Strain RCC931" /LENGTH=189 /DNA_ID=CAMNT_0053322347 /DNA_START=152 /DNA_END=721 /DNA_ORIENTATION=-